MTTLTPRDALEVVRKASWANEEDAHCGCEHCEKKREAIATLSALVERAGEPVACDAIPAHEWETLSVEASEYDSSLEHAWKRCVRCGTRVHVTRDTLPPTAPGASHD